MAGLKFSKNGLMHGYKWIVFLLCGTSCDQDIKPGATGCCELLTKWGSAFHWNMGGSDF